MISNHRILVLGKEINGSTHHPPPFSQTFLYPHPTQSNGKQLAVSIIAKAKGEEEEGSKGRRGGGSGDSGSMDCCICSPMASMYRLPRNAICAPCHEGAKAIISFLNEDKHDDDNGGHGSERSRGSMKPTNSSTKCFRTAPGMREAFEQVKEMREREEEANRRAAYLEQGWALAWEEGIHTDIVVRPGSGPPIPAHKAILAARSEVLRHVLAGDGECKAPAGDAISLPELSHGDLSRFLAFLYTGALDGGDKSRRPEEEEEEEERRLQALLVAGDKYDVAFLRRACEARLAARVGPRNALRALEVAELSSSGALRERAMGAVVEHAEEVVFSPEFGDFAARNAALCVEITRALLAARSSPSPRTTTTKSP
ncbi:hypothetical protein ACP4OV_003358 [Aristida adscensionis]